MSHTPEPWTAIGNSIYEVASDKMHRLASAFNPAHYFQQTEGIALDNATRIVACVNALEGLNPAGVRAVVEALSALVDWCEKNDWGCVPEQTEMAAKQALALVQETR